MRSIQKRNEPHQLTEWRSRYANDINFHYKLIDRDTHQAIIDALLQEQGWLCAYIGVRIEADRCHIEHVKAQDHCTPEETVAYTNIVACYPAPNPKSKTPYGAEKKGSWPAPAEQHLFVSPLDRSCDTRFLFNSRGEVTYKEGDNAAKTTIEKLALNHPILKRFRQAAIQGTLGKTNDLGIKETRRRLKALKSQQDGRLEEFCFVLVQVLEKHVRRLEFIVQSKKRRV